MMFSNDDRILVVAAHPDDEAFGCGGTIAKSISQGAEASLLTLTDGVSARTGDSNDNRDEIDIRKRALEASSKVLGFRNLYRADFPDNRLDVVPLLSLAKKVEEIIAEVHPTVIFVHDISDLNIDHELAHRAVMTACRPTPDSPIRRIFSFEVVSSTEWSLSSPKFEPNVFVDIGDHLDAKLGSIKAYNRELRQFPHPRSEKGIVTLQSFRGMSVGVKAAEAFRLVRCVC